MSATSTSRGKPLPQHLLIKQHIVDRIHSGEIATGEKTESENVLASRFNVSRLTVQRAMRDLVAQGYLTRVQGAGTFVAPRSMRFSLFEVRDLAEEVRLGGHIPEVIVLLQRRTLPDPEVAQMLELDAVTPVFQALLIQKSDKVPAALEERFALCDVFPDFLDQDFSASGVFGFLAQHSHLDTIETTLRAVTPDPQQRSWLELTEPEPCLLLERVNRVNARIVTLTRFLFAGRRFGLGSRYAVGMSHPA